MAVASDTVELSFLDIAADTPIGVAMQLFDTAGLAVYFGVSRTPAILNDDYSIELNEEDDYIDFILTPTEDFILKIAAAAETNVIWLRRYSEFTTPFLPASSFSREAIAEEVDKIWMALQELRNQAFKSIQGPPGDDIMGWLPPAADRALKFLEFDADGNPFASGLSPGDIDAGLAQLAADMVTVNELLDLLEAFPGGVASTVAVTPFTGVIATNVQAALEEIYAETAALVHGHAIGDITDLAAALAALVLDIAAKIPASLLTTRGDIIYRNATVPARLAKGTVGQVLTMGADDPAWAAPAAPPAAIYPPGHIFGLGLLNTVADTTNDITIAAGSARSDDDTTDMVLASAIIKRIDAAWVVGTNQGGMNTGSVANATWYEVLLIKRTDTNVVDVMFSTTANRATLPAGYTKKRRIGWLLRLTAANAQFVQTEDDFIFVTEQSFNLPNGAGLTSVTAPPSTRIYVHVYVVADDSVGSASADAGIGDPTTATISWFQATSVKTTGTGAHTSRSSSSVVCRVNASSQVRRNVSLTGDASGAVGYILGWHDTRGRL